MGTLQKVTLIKQTWTKNVVTALNPFQPSVALLYPLKTSEKPKGFLMFSGGIAMRHWAETD